MVVSISELVPDSESLYQAYYLADLGLLDKAVVIERTQLVNSMVNQEYRIHLQCASSGCAQVEKRFCVQDVAEFDKISGKVFDTQVNSTWFCKAPLSVSVLFAEHDLGVKWSNDMVLVVNWLLQAEHVTGQRIHRVTSPVTGHKPAHWKLMYSGLAKWLSAMEPFLELAVSEMSGRYAEVLGFKVAEQITLLGQLASKPRRFSRLKWARSFGPGTWMLVGDQLLQQDYYDTMWRQSANVFSAIGAAHSKACVEFFKVDGGFTAAVCLPRSLAWDLHSQGVRANLLLPRKTVDVVDSCELERALGLMTSASPLDWVDTSFRRDEDTVGQVKLGELVSALRASFI